MKRWVRNLIAAAAGALLIGGTAGCSTVDTAPDMVALKYKGGIAQSQTFEGCVPAGTFEYNGPGDKSFEYPTSILTYTASKIAGAEAPPIKVVSKDNAELEVPVSVTFTLITDDCEKLREFHEKLAIRDHAYWGGTEFADDQVTNGTPNGWLVLLNSHVGTVLDTTLDRAAQGHNWRALWNDPTVKAQLEQEVEASLSKQIDDRMGGHYFDVHTVLVQKPDPTSEDLKNAVIAEQAAVAKAKAIETEAEANKVSKVKAAEADAAAAEARIAVAKAEAAQVEEQVRVMGQENWIKKYAIDNKVNPYPNPVVPGSNPNQPR